MKGAGLLRERLGVAMEHRTAVTRYRVGLLLQSFLYVASGINHFVHTTSYNHLMPQHYRDPTLWVRLSGVAEIAGGAGLLSPRSQRLAALGLAIMLFAFLDVHQDMVRHPERFPGIPRWVLWARIPLQFALITWAGWYIRTRSDPA